MLERNKSEGASVWEEMFVPSASDASALLGLPCPLSAACDGCQPDLGVRGFNIIHKVAPESQKLEPHVNLERRCDSEPGLPVRQCETS